MNHPLAISILFVGLNGLIALVLSYIVVMERTSTRVWHGESSEDVTTQSKYLDQPGKWAAFVENFTQKFITKTSNDGLLQRKVRAFGNFAEYVPLALLLLITLELMNLPSWLIWLLGSALTVGRITHAWGVIETYGPSPGRALGFFLTWFVYLVGAATCLYYGIREILP
ncbi:MAPEG family protein [Myxosarcina sp. GI1(2024)]